MRKISILLFALLASASLQAQIKGTGDIPAHLYYLMPEFTQGTIYFRGQMPAQGKLNICAVDNTLRFIDKSGQELVATGADNIYKVKIDTVFFLRDMGVYYRLCPIQADMGLAVRRDVRIIRDEKEAAYGGTTQTSAVQSYSSWVADGVVYNLEKDKQYPYTVDEMVYLYKGDSVSLLNKRSLKKLFPDKKAQIDAWFKENKEAPETLEGAKELILNLL